MSCASIETGYLVRYCCPACSKTWTEQWSCACDGECPRCGQGDVEASDYELDGTYTEEQLRIYNLTGALPSSAMAEQQAGSGDAERGAPHG